MTIELTAANVITILALFVMALWALAKVIAHVHDKRSTERFHRAEQRLSELESGLERTHHRLALVEAALRDVPGHDDLGKIYERVNRMTEEVKSLAGEFAGARHTLGLLHQFLLNGGNAR